MSSGGRKGTPGRGWDDFEVPTECILSRKVLGSTSSCLVSSCGSALPAPHRSNRGAKAVRKRDWLARLMPVWPGLGRTARLVASPARRPSSATNAVALQPTRIGGGGSGDWFPSVASLAWREAEVQVGGHGTALAALAALTGHEMRAAAALLLPF